MKIGACGNRCDTCDIYQATALDDKKKYKDLSKIYKSKSLKLKAKDMPCKGCHNTEGINYKYCLECKVRKCTKEQGIENCGVCKYYPCNLIQKFNAHKSENEIILSHISSL